jgi:hypothetical protein
MTIVRIALCLAVCAVAVADSDPNDQSQCARNFNSSITCPPPSGALVFDFTHTPVCGRGQCMRDGRGIWMCSTQPGGRAMRGSTGQVMCVGGCQQATAELCEVAR